MLIKKRILAVVDETEVQEIADNMLSKLMDSNLAFYQMLGVLELVKIELVENYMHEEDEGDDDE